MKVLQGTRQEQEAVETLLVNLKDRIESRYAGGDWYIKDDLNLKDRIESCDLDELLVDVHVHESKG